MLASLPPGSDPTRREFGAVLGSRVAVTARVAEMLPGTTFETRGLTARGIFKRAAYQIAFSVEGHEPTTIDVVVEGAEGFTALKRLADKNGWQAIDPAAGAFVDLDRSRTAGRAVAIRPGGDDPTIRMRVPVEAPAAKRRPLWPVAAVVLLAAGVPAAWYLTRGPRGASDVTITLTPWPPPYLHLPSVGRTSSPDAR